MFVTISNTFINATKSHCQCTHKLKSIQNMKINVHVAVFLTISNTFIDVKSHTVSVPKN